VLTSRCVSIYVTLRSTSESQVGPMRAKRTCLKHPGESRWTSRCVSGGKVWRTRNRSSSDNFDVRGWFDAELETGEGGRLSEELDNVADITALRQVKAEGAKARK
jgi:hypothetical protein